MSLLADRHGDVVASLTTGGAITDSIAYTPWGEPSARHGATSLTVGYQSSYTDPTTGLIDMGARWYQTSTGTFTNRDTYDGVLSAPISLNRYTYANNNPLDYFDPDGRKACREGARDCGLDLHGTGLKTAKPKPSPAKSTISSGVNSASATIFRAVESKKSLGCREGAQGCGIDFDGSGMRTGPDPTHHGSNRLGGCREGSSGCSVDYSVQDFGFDPVKTSGTTGTDGICPRSLGGGPEALSDVISKRFGIDVRSTGYNCKELDYRDPKTGIIPPELNQTCDGQSYLPKDYPVTSTCWSNHASGRAIDLMMDLDHNHEISAAERAIGNQIVDWLMANGPDGKPAYNARIYGVQQFIWNTGYPEQKRPNCWTSNQSDDIGGTSHQDLGLCDPKVKGHADHIHIDLTKAGSQKQTTGYAGD